MLLVSVKTVYVSKNILKIILKDPPVIFPDPVEDSENCLHSVNKVWLKGIGYGPVDSVAEMNLQVHNKPLLKNPR